MPNLVAISQATTEIIRGRNRLPQGIECFKSLRSDRVKSYTRVSIATNENNEQRISKTLIDHFSTTRKQYISEEDV